MDKPFRDRASAGQALGDAVVPLGLARPVVLALPRGGVPVAVEVARRLARSGSDVVLDVFVARKIGAPFQPELGLGAIAEGGEPVFDAALLDRLGLRARDLADVVTAEREELARRVRAYRGDRPLPPLAGADVVLVDDGLATGGTARAGLRALRGSGVRRSVLAVPVAPPDTLQAMRWEAEDVMAVLAPEDFRAVGRWYECFPQLTDEEVLELLQPWSGSRG